MNKQRNKVEKTNNEHELALQLPPDEGGHLLSTICR